MSQPQQPVIILLVEDSADDVFFFHRAVRKSGILAVTNVASDGLEAMEYLTNKGRFDGRPPSPPPDIMFLDLKLPHVNGFEVLEWMRRQAECPRLPVVVLTSSSQPEDQERAEGLGASLFMTKPPTPEQLREVLQKFELARVETPG